MSEHRPGIAVISNSHTPYRLHLHQRIAREMPEVKLWSIFTHEISNASWYFDDAAAASINSVLFGKGEASAMQSALRFSFREWARAGRIIAWMIDRNIRFVLMMGYNDLGRMRIIYWCQRMGIPCWLFGDSNILGDDCRGVKGAVKRLLLPKIVRLSSGIFCCGSLGRDYFLKYGAASDRCIYFPYEPDYALIQDLDDESIDAVRHRFGLRKNRRRIVFSGRLIDVKRPDLALAAFIAIAESKPDWDLLMIGDGPLRASLKATVPAHLANRVTWTGFLDDQVTISALYRVSDVLLIPSDKEPWALVVNEAVAAGMAVVSSDVVGATAELVSDGDNGRIFPAGDLVALKECLSDVMDRTVRSDMRAASLRKLTSWRVVADPIDGLRRALSISHVRPYPNAS